MSGALPQPGKVICNAPLLLAATRVPGYVRFTKAIASDIFIPFGGKKSNPSPAWCDPVFVVVKPCALNASWCFCVLNPLVGRNPSFPRSPIGFMSLPLKVTRRSRRLTSSPHSFSRTSRAKNAIKLCGCNHTRL